MSVKIVKILVFHSYILSKDNILYHILNQIKIILFFLLKKINYFVIIYVIKNRQGKIFILPMPNILTYMRSSSAATKNMKNRKLRRKGNVNFMRAVITVVGKDMVGILAKVSSICAEKNVNITEVTQSILQDMFCMIMMADVTNCSIEFSDFSDILSEYGKSNGLSIHVMNEDIFNSMHRI